MSNQPTLIAYTVKSRKGQKSVWTKIGAAWPHNSGQGLNIELEALPTDGRIVLLEPKEAADTFEGGAA